MPRYPKINKKRKLKCLGNRKVPVLQQEISIGSDSGSSETRPTPTLTPLQDLPKRDSASKGEIGGFARIPRLCR